MTIVIRKETNDILEYNTIGVQFYKAYEKHVYTSLDIKKVLDNI